MQESDTQVQDQGKAPKRFPCAQCGAQLLFKPGAQALTCEHCGYVNPIPQSAEDIHELDFHEYLEVARQESVLETEQTIKCQACASEFVVGARTTSDRCPFCGSATVIPIPPEIRLRPKSLLPFRVEEKRCREIYKKWVTTRFWAPRALRDYHRAQGQIRGMYIPYWTYDTDTTTYYTGMRGEHYWETETYRDSNGNTQTREVQKTRWYPASGTVWRYFDDVLVAASTTLPNKHIRAIEEWDMQSLVPYQDEYLSGFLAERYNIGLEPGFDIAKGIMKRVIEQDIRYDIGGDEQQIHSMDTQYDNITFKHTLLPIYVGAYKYRGKTYQFLINARTGKISGDAPISVWKVLLAILIGLSILALIFYFTGEQG